MKDALFIFISREDNVPLLWLSVRDAFPLVILTLMKSFIFGVKNDTCLVWRQCGPLVRALALRSGDPGFKTCSDHSLNLILVVPGSTSQLHL